jgi:hypothetical protein
MKPLPRLAVFLLSIFIGMLVWAFINPQYMGFPFDSYPIPIYLISVLVANFLVLGFMRPRVLLGFVGITVGQGFYFTLTEPSDAFFILGLAISLTPSILISILSYISFLIVNSSKD